MRDPGPTTGVYVIRLIMGRSSLLLRLLAILLLSLGQLGRLLLLHLTETFLVQLGVLLLDLVITMGGLLASASGTVLLLVSIFPIVLSLPYQT
jgi:hypothetical protein